MTTHITGTREEWLAARLDLLKAEKELTRRGDELAQRRQALPWVMCGRPLACKDFMAMDRRLAVMCPAC
jgi:predicted dithiol-disulfide oxidoreductase (DUF899 family)